MHEAAPWTGRVGPARSRQPVSTHRHRTVRERGQSSRRSRSYRGTPRRQRQSLERPAREFERLMRGARLACHLAVATRSSPIARYSSGGGNGGASKANTTCLWNDASCGFDEASLAEDIWELRCCQEFYDLRRTDAGDDSLRVESFVTNR